MAVVSASANQFSVKAYTGDNKTLPAFDFEDETLPKNLVGLTIARIENIHPSDGGLSRSSGQKDYSARMAICANCGEDRLISRFSMRGGNIFAMQS